MKRWLLLLLLLIASPAWGATTYFGYGSDSAGALNVTPSEQSGYGNGFDFSWYANSAWLTTGPWSTAWTAPGSGAQNVTDIAVYIKTTAGSPSVNVGVYKSTIPGTDDGVTSGIGVDPLIAYCTSAFTPTGSAGFQGCSGAGITQLSTITPGNVYYVLITATGAGGVTYSVYEASGDSTSAGYIDHTYHGASMPSTAPTQYSGEKQKLGRIGVEAAAAPPTAVRHRVIQQ